MLCFIAKCASKLHIDQVIYKVIRPFYHSKVVYNKETVDKALTYLSKLHPDCNNSSICKDKVLSKAYDLQIIIPAYNVGKYIKECIESVISQSVEFSYICTIVNDGSTDNTGTILENYVSNPNIEIITQKNRGLSGARNRALENIKGKYIMFLDSDDKLAEGSINAFMRKAKETDADIIEGGYSMFTYGNFIKSTFLHKNALLTNWYRTLYGFPWGKIYKAELFQNIQFPEAYWFEDTIMSLLIYPICKQIVTISDLVYFYRINPKGITATSRHNIKCLDSLWITKRLLEDRAYLHLDNNGIISSFIMKQFTINSNRIQSLDDNTINRYVFIVTIFLYEKYFSQLKIQHPLVPIFRNHDFKAYKLYYLFNRKRK